MEKNVFDKIRERLPKNIMEAEELDDVSKNIIVKLVYWLRHSKASETGLIKISNKKLLELLGMNSMRKLMVSLEELDDYSLVSRKRGTGLGDASAYYLHFENFTRPLRKKSDSEYLEELMSIQNLSKSPFGLDIDKDIDKDIDIDKDKDIDKDINTDTNTDINKDNDKDNDIDIDTDKDVDVNNDTDNKTDIEIDKDKEQQEFLKKRQLVIDKIRKEAYGKDYSAINKLTIPMLNWVSGEFPDDSDRLKKIVNNTLNKIKNELDGRNAIIQSST